MDIKEFLNNYYILVGIVSGIVGITLVIWATVKNIKHKNIAIVSIFFTIIIIFGALAFILSPRGIGNVQVNKQKITPTPTLTSLSTLTPTPTKTATPRNVITPSPSLSSSPTIN